jgi:hypothetical protein
MTVKEIIKKYLQDNGYQGLYYPGDCGCSMEDLIACSEDCSECEPGYKHRAGEDSEWDDIICGKKEINEVEDGHCITCDCECPEVTK